jgi:hypothetical protein
MGFRYMPVPPPSELILTELMELTARLLNIPERPFIVLSERVSTNPLAKTRLSARMELMPSVLSEIALNAT